MMKSHAEPSFYWKHTVMNKNTENQADTVSFRKMLISPLARNTRKAQINKQGGEKSLGCACGREGKGHG